MTEEKKYTPKYVNTPEDLIFYTDTDQTEYPIYILNDKSIQYKKKPEQYIAMFFVKAVESTDEDLKHPLLPTVDQAFAGYERRKFVIKKKIKYEVYDETRFIGEATAYAIKIEVEIMSANEKQAWAVAFDTRERTAKRYPELAKYAYPHVEWQRRRGYVSMLVIKLPIATEELRKIFDTVMARASIAQVSPLAELEEQVRQLEQLIEQKRAELQALEQQLQNLKMKLELERLKQAVA